MHNSTKCVIYVTEFPEGGDNAGTCRSLVIQNIHTLQNCAFVGVTRVLKCHSVKLSLRNANSSCATFVLSQDRAQKLGEENYIEGENGEALLQGPLGKDAVRMWQASQDFVGL